jgi:hypothetical protein
VGFADDHLIPLIDHASAKALNAAAHALAEGGSR